MESRSRGRELLQAARWEITGRSCVPPCSLIQIRFVRRSGSHSGCSASNYAGKRRTSTQSTAVLSGAIFWSRNSSSKRFKIETTAKTWRSIAIRFGQHHRTLPNLQLFAIGAGVGLFSSALGVGGGFLLVPIFAMVYRLPIYVMVAATIPYTIVLSLVGILTFMFVLPAFGTPSIGPEWSWGFFTAAGGLFGSWSASKTQLYVPEHLLNWLLGGITAAVGILYILSFFFKLPFAL